MNVIFLTIARISDINEHGIYTDLMRKFRNEGHNVYIVYPLERQCNCPTSLSVQDNINMLGVQCLNIQKTNFIEKGIATLLIEYQFDYAIRKYWHDIRFDLILYSTPPITFTKVIQNLKKCNEEAVSYLLLKDIFPQNAVDLQLFSKRSLFYWLFRRKERLLYKVSDYIGCMSPANVQYVLGHNPYLSKQIVEHNPNSIEINDNKRILNKQQVRKVFGLPEDKIIFIYGGNLGKPQGLDFLIEVLNSNLSREDCYFLIVGSGTEYSKLKEWFDKNNPTNAKLLKGLPKTDYDDLVASCDVGLIFLDPRFTIPNYPSRLLSYLENGMPILAATDPNTDIGDIAKKNGFGIGCLNGDIQAFNICLNKFLNVSAVTEMGRKGYAFLLENYTIHHSYNTIIKHFENV